MKDAPASRLRGGSALSRLSDQLETGTRAEGPKAKSLEEFLENHARVKLAGGEYGPYSFDGRKVLRHITERFDLILGSHTGKPLPDSTFDICGGAQWGKTIYVLNLGMYLTSCLFYNWGYYLPDDDLVQGIVDTKLRPDVIEQITPKPLPPTRRRGFPFRPSPPAPTPSGITLMMSTETPA